MRGEGRSSFAERSVRSVFVTYVALLVVVPLAALVARGLAEGPSGLAWVLTDDTSRAAMHLTISTALLVGVGNVFLGTAVAWVLVRMRFRWRPLLSSLIDLPLAVPTLVAGLMIATLYGPASLVGARLASLGVEVAFAAPGIVLALLFVALPFVVRAVEPVLREIDPSEEEAARLLGASPWQTFRTVFLPSILPAAVSGGMRSIARALGEFGSVVVVAGNIPQRTLTAPVYVFGEIEAGAPGRAAAASIVLLALTLALFGAANVVESRTGARRGAR